MSVLRTQFLFWCSLRVFLVASSQAEPACSIGAAVSRPRSNIASSGPGDPWSSVSLRSYRVLCATSGRAADAIVSAVSFSERCEPQLTAVQITALKVIVIMHAKDFEKYVADIVKELSSFRNASILLNEVFVGVRQPGKYEIDIAVKLLLDEVLSFLMIIECKNWRRPIDRPVIQKLIQTRDAIAAQKAAVVSPVCFTKEAIGVAEANGIALWIIAYKSKYITVLNHCNGTWHRPEEYQYEELRIKLCHLVGLDITVDNDTKLINFELPYHERQANTNTEGTLFTYTPFYDTNATKHANTPGIDAYNVMTGVVNDIAYFISNSEATSSHIGSKFQDWKSFVMLELSGENDRLKINQIPDDHLFKRLYEFNYNNKRWLDKAAIGQATAHLINGDRYEFLRLFSL